MCKGLVHSRANSGAWSRVRGALMKSRTSEILVPEQFCKLFQNLLVVSVISKELRNAGHHLFELVPEGALPRFPRIRELQTQHRQCERRKVVLAGDNAGISTARGQIDEVHLLSDADEIGHSCIAVHPPFRVEVEQGC
eukprot:m.409695 g.409695  ORF g.409695 m.409695 type:complete len:138 (-) comp16801_c3_seq11:4463-4876(-)